MADPLTPINSPATQVPFVELNPFSEGLMSRLRKGLKFLTKLVGLILVFFMSFSWVVIALRILTIAFWAGLGWPYHVYWLDIWMGLEALFLLAMNMVKYRAFRDIGNEHLPTLDNPRDFELVYQEMVHNVSDHAEFLQGWFFNTSIDKISRRDFMEWCAGTFFK